MVRAIRSSRVLIDSMLIPATVYIDQGRITAVDRSAPRGLGVIDVGDLALLPGVIDTHVHVNEPGRTEWEGFASAGRAAAAGGVTTMVVMPLNCTPSATNSAALQAEAAAAARASLVDFGFWGGLIHGNASELASMRAAGALGFKCFLVHSGVDDFPNVIESDLNAAAPIIREMRDAQGRSGHVPLLIHAEDQGSLDAARACSGLDEHPRSYRAYLASRPDASEVVAINRMIQLCRDQRVRTHIVHVAAAGALAALAAARREGLPISAETCPHYLTIAAESIGDAETLYKCAPPIRTKLNQDQLWAGLRDSTLSTIGSDHSPCPPQLKQLTSGDFRTAWGGISSLELTLPVVWTEAMARDIPLADIFGWLSSAPAHLAGLKDRKGRLAAGLDADLIVLDAEMKWIVDGEHLHHRHKLTPYHGRSVFGRVLGTLVRGRPVYACPTLAREFAVEAALDEGGFALETTGQWITPTRR